VDGDDGTVVRTTTLILACCILLGGCSTKHSPDAPYATDHVHVSGSPSPLVVRLSSSPGWTVTVYYTAVAGLHHGTPEKVTGCRTRDCTHGRDDLGTYPSDFVKAVKDEGTGKITDGTYLNWSYDTGYWLDTAARDAAGRPLEGFSSAAADKDVLKAGTRFTISQCGRGDDNATIDPVVCAKLKASHWTITDEFTPGFGGPHHIDAYIGEETGADFTASTWYTTLHDAHLTIRT
jgi:hypothetical protein